MIADGHVEAAVPVRALSVAQKFYEGAVGLQPSGSHTPGVDVVYECGDGTRLMLYEWPGPHTRGRTVAHVIVRDVADTVRELRSRGIEFDEYDTPRLRTIDGVATIGDRHYAWFHHPDDNVIGYRRSSGRRSAESSASVCSPSPTGTATTTTRRSRTPTMAGPPSASLSAGDRRLRSSS